MPVQNKKERKQQKLRDRKRREAARRQRRKARAASNASEADSQFDGAEPLDDSDELVASDEPDQAGGWLDETSESETQLPKLSEQADAALRLWWDEYSDADGPTRLKMIREKLATVSADDETYRHLFPESVLELESILSSAQYVGFLEELYESRHDVFSMSADWNTRSMVYEYLSQDRLSDVDRVVMALAKELKAIDEPFFSLMSTIRLAGRAEPVQALVEVGTQQLKASSLMYWAVGEVLEWAMFSHYQRCIAAGATDEAIEAVHAAARQLDIEDSKESQANRREFVLHLSGQSDQRWTKSQLISGKKKAYHNVYLLCVGYQRWLCEERAFKPIVADEMRSLVIGAINGIDCPFNRVLVGLTRSEFEPYLAGKIGFMSLSAIQAPATIVAMKHFYDYLQELELMKPGDYQQSQSVCDVLWEELRRALHDQWPSFRFLQHYLIA